MSEDFANSGWKDKKLWEPPKPEQDERTVGNRAAGRLKPASTLATTAPGAPNSTKHGAPPGLREKMEAEDGPASKLKETALDSETDDGPKKTKPVKKAKPPPSDPLEALDPDSSSEEESDDDDKLPPEYAVLDLTVPRTALVINVSHVLKRLSGCCSLNQLNKALKNFREKTEVTLETFLRANPMNFKLEGRIVYLLDRDGQKWKAPKAPPPEKEQAPPPAKAKGSGKGKANKKGNENQQAVEAEGGKGKSGKKSNDEQKASRGGGGDGYSNATWGEATAATGKKSKKKANAGQQWSAQSWDTEWSTSAWKSTGSQWSWK
jgi:hypothetical protein